MPNVDRFCGPFRISEGFFADCRAYMTGEYSYINLCSYVKHTFLFLLYSVTINGRCLMMSACRFENSSYSLPFDVLLTSHKQLSVRSFFFRYLDCIQLLVALLVILGLPLDANF